ncbi:MAG TPA: hypothetical protein VF815_12695 [Myxococcaceae bacterium]|jgi:hypothetical protein
MREIILPADELNEFDLPRVCVVTGQTENVVFKPVNFAWYPRWVAVFILINLLVAAIIAFALTKRVKGHLPFTEEAFKAWRTGITLFALSIVAGIGLFFGSIFLLASNHGELGSVAMLAALVVPIFVGVKFTRRKGPVVQRIKDGQITLKLPSEEAVMMIKHHLVSGRKAPRAVPQGQQQSA